jgi:hypothetical protein
MIYTADKGINKLSLSRQYSLRSGSKLSLVIPAVAAIKPSLPAVAWQDCLKFGAPPLAALVVTAAVMQSASAPEQPGVPAPITPSAKPGTMMQLAAQDSGQDDRHTTQHWRSSVIASTPGLNTPTTGAEPAASPAASTTLAEAVGGRGGGEIIPEPASGTGDSSSPVVDVDLPELPSVDPTDPASSDSDPDPDAAEPDDDAVINLPVLQVGVDVFPSSTILGLAP